MAACCAYSIMILFSKKPDAINVLQHTVAAFAYTHYWAVTPACCARSKCQVYESPKKPEWADCDDDGCDEWWYKGGYGSGKYGYGANSYGKSWTAYDSYYKNSRGGKTKHYYKDYDTYKKYYDGCGSSQCDYEPEYYYKQVYPLASFKVKCDKEDTVYDVYKFKWNKKYVAPRPINCLPVQLIITLDAGVTCADVNLDYLRGNLTLLFEYILENFGDIISYIGMDPRIVCVDSVSASLLQ
jgi:hypothetical protein